MKRHSLALAFSYLPRSKDICHRVGTTVLSGGREGLHWDAARLLHLLLCSQIWQSYCPHVWRKLVVNGWKDQHSYGVVEADWGTSHCRRQDIFFSMSPSFPEKEAWGQSRSKRQKWGQADGERQPGRSGLRTRQKPEKARIAMSPSDTLAQFMRKASFW